MPLDPNYVQANKADMATTTGANPTRKLKIVDGVEHEQQADGSWQPSDATAKMQAGFTDMLSRAKGLFGQTKGSAE